MTNTRSINRAYQIRLARYAVRHQGNLENIINSDFKAAADYLVKNGTTTLPYDLIKPTPYQNSIRALYQDVFLKEATLRYNNLAKLKSEGEQLQTKAGLNDILYSWLRYLTDYVEFNMGLRITNIVTTTLKAINEVIQNGLTEGKGYKEIAKDVLVPAGRINAKARALLITRTESGTAANLGAMQAAKSSGLLMRKKWVHGYNENRENRQHHIELGDNPAIDINAHFLVNGKMMEYPGDPSGGAVEICNCFLPDQLTSVNKEIIKHAFRSMYDGEVVTIHTTDTKNFTCTINHPILTTEGWVKAGELTKLHKLVKSSYIDTLSPVNFNVKDNPSTFEEVYNLISCLTPAMRVSGAVVNFNGYVPTGYVNIVRANSFLRENRNTGFIESNYNRLFVLPHFIQGLLFSLSSLSDKINEILFGLFSNDLVSVGRNSTSFGWRKFVHPNNSSFASTSVINTSRSKHPHNYTPGKSVVLSNPLNADTIIERVNNVSDFGVVSDIVRHRYKGFVYTFETDYQMYDINSYVAKNCKCSITFVPVRDANGMAIRLNNNEGGNMVLPANLK